jgi:hypothetical protein
MFQIAIVVLLTTVTNGQLHGILMNGRAGTQLYDPYNTPHARDNLLLELHTDSDTFGSAALINGQLAYFASGYQGMSNAYLVNMLA